MGVYRTQVRIDYPGDGGPGFNTFHFRTISEADLFDRFSTVTGALQGVFTEVDNYSAPGSRYSHDGQWRRVGGTPGEVDVPGWQNSVAGSGAALPDFVSLLAQHRTSAAGRSGRGRSFLGPLSVSALQSNGTPLEAARTAVAGAFNALWAQFSDADFGAFVIWSSKDQVGRDIVSTSVSNEFASLTTRRD